MAQRKNYNLEDNVVQRLEELSEYYGMNQTAMISMLVTDKYVQVAKEPQKIPKEETEN